MSVKSFDDMALPANIATSTSANDLTKTLIELNKAAVDTATDIKLGHHRPRRSSLRNSLFIGDCSNSASGGLDELNDDIMSTTSTLSATSSSTTLTYRTATNDETLELILCKQQLKDVQYAYNKLRIENETLNDEIECIKHEMEELQDQFRLDDADEFRQLQAELEIATKNCRILQFKLRKLEKRNDTLETDKLILHDKLDEFANEIERTRNLEEELLIAKEVSIRLHSELEQAEEWRKKTEKLNKELKHKLDELKEQVEYEIKNHQISDENHSLVLIDKLYESMYKEYILQEQLASQINLNANQEQMQNDRKELREVTELLNSYQQKFSFYNDEINLLKQELYLKDKELDQLKLQLKNLKRSRSLEPRSGDSQRRGFIGTPSVTPPAATVASTNDESTRQQRSTSAEPPGSKEARSKQIDIAYDEIRLLKNKITRLEDDLQFVTQERDCLASQLDKIEEKAMKQFSTSIEIVEPDDEDGREAVNEIDLDTIVAKQMIDLKTKYDKLNRDSRENEAKNNELTEELKTLRTQMKPQLSSDEDKDKQISDLRKKLIDYELLNSNERQRLSDELKARTSDLNGLKELIRTHQTHEAELNEIVNEKKILVDNLRRNLSEQEGLIESLKKSNESFKQNEASLNENIEKLNEKLVNCEKELNEKINNIEYFKNENKLLQERISVDEKRVKNLLTELNKVDDLKKSNCTYEALLKEKEALIGDLQAKLNSNSKYREDYLKLEDKYLSISKDLESKCTELCTEINRLNKDKDSLNSDLQQLKSRQLKESSQTPHSHDHNTDPWNKVQSIAVKAKYDTKCQYYELEINNLKAKMAKLTNDKKVQEHVLREAQQLAKDVSHKYTMDSDSWNRQRQHFAEKEKMYEESIEVRKELRVAADKLRQKLQILEEQVMEKQNKHVIEKNNWETQRLQLVSTVNRLEEQLNKYKIPKKSKKEIEAGWDKERKELHHQIQTMQIFMKDMQSQLTQKHLTHTLQPDSLTNNDVVQSLQGENDFLKNRIKELEMMLDEMEQCKRFLLDLKEAYETEKTEWFMAKQEFNQQLEIRDKIQAESESRFSYIINEIIKLNNPESHHHKERLHVNIEPIQQHELNNLCGTASNIVSRPATGHTPLNTPTSTNSHRFEYQSPSRQHRHDADTDVDEADSDSTTKRMFSNEFSQMFKKLERVKENFNTHKKFMDIVKLKSSKVTSRPVTKETSVSSLQVNEMFQFKKPELRGSVPPESRTTMSSFIPKRAKSVSKEPNPYDGKTPPSSSMPSRFFSLSRRFPKLGFSSKQQAASTSTLALDKPKQVVTSSSQSAKDKAPARERTLSPSRIFRNLRSRSPFSSKTTRSTTAPSTTRTTTTTTTTSATSPNIMTASTTSAISTTSSNAPLTPQSLMTMSCYSTVNTRVSDKPMIENRSISCEFIDTSQLALNLNKKTAGGGGGGSSALLEDLKEGQISGGSSVLPFANRTITTQRMKKVTLKSESPAPSFDTISLSGVGGGGGDSMKSVKFKEPPEIQVSHQQQQQATRNKAEEQLINALDEAIMAAAKTTTTGGNHLTPSSSFTTSLNEDERRAPKLVEQSSTEKPPKPPQTVISGATAATTASTTRVKFSTTKSKTIDFPDLLQGTLDGGASSTANSNSTTNPKPITSILRRSETPPSTKFRQASIESNESNRDRESSIEKRLKATTSTSRPLMFNN